MFVKDGVEYERNVMHCEVSTYIKKVTIKSVEPAINSDNLDKIEFEEIGWTTIYKKGMLKKYQEVVFIPAESVLPLELSNNLGVTNYLSRGRVKVVRLRGNRSEGLIVEYHEVEPWLNNILQWEDLPTIQMKGECEKFKDVPINFHKFYHMSNILNDPYVFKPGDSIYYSEKIHGINVRCGKLKNPETGEYTIYVGSHNTVLRQNTKNIYWKIVIEYLEDILPEDIVFFGDIYGLGIQNLHYDEHEPKVRIFAASEKGEYIHIEMLKNICRKSNIPIVNFYKTKFESIEQIRKLADEPSEYTNSHFREGIVMVSDEYPEKMAKCIGFNYWSSKGRTERH